MSRSEARPSLSATAVAMKWGDHCWLKGLQVAPHLNGKHVVLDKWMEDTGRWRCLPHGWSHTEPTLGVKPKNLSNEPPSQMDISDGTEEEPFMGLIKAMERDGIDTSGFQTFSMTTGSKGEGATIEECLANAQADSDRIRRERQERQTLHHPESPYYGMTRQERDNKIDQEFKDAQKLLTPEQRAQGGIMMPPEWSDPQPSGGFQDWMSYIPAAQKRKSHTPTGILELGLKYMPRDHPERAKVHKTLDSVRAMQGTKMSHAEAHI